MPNRLLTMIAFAGSVVLAPTPAFAQFTTFIPHQARTIDSAKTAVAVQKRAAVVADSVTRGQIANMKSWVDSAAGVTAPATGDTTTISAASAPQKPTAPSTSDPLAASPAKPARTSVARSTVGIDTLRNGAKAPETASNLPFIALLGLLTLTSGAVMLRREPECAD